MTTEQHRYEPDWASSDTDNSIWWEGRPAGRPDSTLLPVCSICRASQVGLQHAVPGEAPRDYWAEYGAWWYEQHPGVHHQGCTDPPAWCPIEDCGCWCHE